MDHTCKLLVRKINHDTTEDELKEFYSQWGTVEDCKIVRSRETMKSRGFGFIRYSTASSIDDAMAYRPHNLGGNTLEPHRSAPKEYSERIESHHSVNDIHVGRMSEEIDENDLMEAFGSYGKIEKVVIPKDNAGKFKGFAVVSFDDYDPVDQLCYIRNHTVKDKKVLVSKYIPKQELEELKRRYGQTNSNDFSYNNDQYQNGYMQDYMYQRNMNYQNWDNFGPMRGRRFGGGGGGGMPYNGPSGMSYGGMSYGAGGGMPYGGRGRKY